jgi:UPF0271 protein
MTKKIDLNCDMGESFGAWRMGNDAALMDSVSSVNIACGFHAGDPCVIKKTVETAIKKGVSVGAHPSFPDLQGFGRREMKLSPEEVFDIVLYQISAVKGICESMGIKLHHVKPHGALYNQAAKDKAIAKAIAEAVKSLDDNLILYGLSGSHSITEAELIGPDPCRRRRQRGVDWCIGRYCFPGVGSAGSDYRRIIYRCCPVRLFSVGCIQSERRPGIATNGRN